MNRDYATFCNRKRQNKADLLCAECGGCNGKKGAVPVDMLDGLCGGCWSNPEVPIEGRKGISQKKVRRRKAPSTVIRRSEQLWAETPYQGYER